MSRHHRLIALAAAGASLAVAAGPASAAEAPSAAELKLTSVFDGSLTASDGSSRAACNTAFRPGAPGVATRTVRVSGPGYIDARMNGTEGDWDLAVFDATGEAVAADASADAQEVATGWTLEGGELRVQACRRSGGAASMPVELKFGKLTGDAKAAKADPPQLVSVMTPTRADKDRLGALGLDMTEHGGTESLGVVLHGRRDAKTLLDAGFRWRTLTSDLVARDVASRTFEGGRPATSSARRAAAGGPTYPAMAERTTYRTLADYNNLLKKMAEENPGLVRLIVLPEKTYEGREVLGVEIAKDVERNDGRPAFLNMGVHHAREWPSSEHAMEWAVELLNGFSKGDPRATKIVEQSRNLIVPVINPDGYNASRTAGVGAAGGRDESVPDTLYLVAGAGTGGEYRRKNCRLPNNANAGNCATSAGIAEPGVDPNRNYGGLWGGPGADASNVLAQTYRGPGPFSEPETRNVKALVSRNQVMSLITNHTTAGLLLRSPGLASLGDPVDENKGYKQLGDDMALHNGYFSQKSFELYDTTGTTEDWSYNATGGFGFTFEVYCGKPNYATGDCNDPAFHPSFARVIEEYDGTSPQADHKDDPGKSEENPFGSVKGFDGKGNREAYYIAAESAINEERHSVLEGKAPAGTTLRLTKEFKTDTFPQASNGGKPLQTDDKLETIYDVGESGAFRWHVNPSTRPIVAKERGEREGGVASPPEEPRSGSPAGAEDDPNDDGAVPGADAEAPSSLNYNDHPIVIPAEGDNRSVNVRIEWQSAATDWDIRLYEDSDGDGSSDGETKQVATSENGATTEEEVGTTGTPKLVPGMKYVLRVTNFAAVEPYDLTIIYNGPEPFQPAQVETYTLTCERGEQVLDTQQVQIDRGQVKPITLAGGCAPPTPTPTPTPTGTPTPTPTSTPGNPTPTPTPTSTPGNPTPTPTPTSTPGNPTSTPTPTNTGNPTPNNPTTPGGGPNGNGTNIPNAPQPCVAGGGFNSVAVSPSGSGAKLGFSRRIEQPVTVSVFQQSSGRRVTGERLVARFSNRSSDVSWNGRATVRGRKVTDGYYFVRYRMGTGRGADTRRVVLQRRNGRFARRADFYRRATCDLLPSFKLTRPVFGGSVRPATLSAAFRVSQQAQVTVEVLRGSKVVRRFAARAAQPDRTVRLRIDSKGLSRGQYTVKITAVAGAERLTTSLVSRRL